MRAGQFLLKVKMAARLLNFEKIPEVNERIFNVCVTSTNFCSMNNNLFFSTFAFCIILSEGVRMKTENSRFNRLKGKVSQALLFSVSAC
jgi:hypothetical protein